MPVYNFYLKKMKKKIIAYALPVADINFTAYLTVKSISLMRYKYLPVIF